MKTIWGVIMIVVIGLFIFTGVSSINSLAFVNQVETGTTLDDDSLNFMSQYDAQIVEFRTEFNSSTANLNKQDSMTEPDLNTISEFVQEYKENKDKIDKIKDVALLIYKIPDIIIWTIPVLTVDDLGLFIEVYRVLIWAIILIVLYKALRNGQVDSND
jgi:hypothetical protein